MSMGIASFANECHNGYRVLVCLGCEPPMKHCAMPAGFIVLPAFLRGRIAF